jgi:hypothetical protein
MSSRWFKNKNPGYSQKGGGEGMPIIGPNRRLHAAASVFLCLLLAVCAAPSTPARWLKAGADGATTDRELSDCNEQASAWLASEQRIIDATVGRNWMLQGMAVVPLQRQLMRQEAAENAEQVLNNCMRAKGFTKEG